MFPSPFPVPCLKDSPSERFYQYPRVRMHILNWLSHKENENMWSLISRKNRYSCQTHTVLSRIMEQIRSWSRFSIGALLSTIYFILSYLTYISYLILSYLYILSYLILSYLTYISYLILSYLYILSYLILSIYLILSYLILSLTNNIYIKS